MRRSSVWNCECNTIQINHSQKGLALFSCFTAVHTFLWVGVGVCMWERVYQNNYKGWGLYVGDSLSAQLQGLGFVCGRHFISTITRVGVCIWRQFISTITRVGVCMWETLYQHNYKGRGLHMETVYQHNYKGWGLYVGDTLSAQL